MSFSFRKYINFVHIYVLVLIMSQERCLTETFENRERNISNRNSACYVNEYESHEKRKCQFPFSIRDKLTGETKTFIGCTTYWCVFKITNL